MTKKYRPYLTLAELKTLQSLTLSFPDLHHYLSTVIIQAEAGTRKPNLTLQPPAPTLEQKLGFSPPVPVVEEVAPGRTIEQLLHLTMNGLPCFMTPDELQRLNNYKYLNDLMTEKEKDDYEKANGLCF